VDSALGLVGSPFQPLAEAFGDFRGKVLPSGVAVFAREHQLGIAL
jgi:hypothetical protein